MKKFRFISAALVSAFVFLAVGCQKEISSNDEIYRPLGSKIVFTVSTEYDNGVATKAEYSGVVSTSNSRERIDWVDGDPIKIVYNGEAESYTVDGDPSAVDASSKAAITGNLVWKVGPHTFKALYPDNTYGSISEDGVVTGSIPADQSVTASDLKTVNGVQKYQPHTASYGFMVGYKYIDDASTVSTVELPFKPAFTTFEFKLKGQAASSSKVTKAVLSSVEGTDGADMTGGFHFTITEGNDSGATWGTVSVESGSGRSITVEFPSGGVDIPTDGYLDFSFLTLPINQKGLSLTLFYADNTTLVLRLKDGMSAGNPDSGSWHEFTGGQKYVITNDYVPIIEYTFGTLSDVSVDYTGGSRSMASAFVSYKSKGAVNEAVSFTLEYSEDGTNWSTDAPSWLTPGSIDTGGSVTGQPIALTVGHQANSWVDPHPAALRANGTYTEAHDLSTDNVATGVTVARTTANCYVVDRPGLYKFPLVYGNGVQGGSNTLSAYRGREGLDGSWVTPHGVDGYLGYFKDHNDNYITSPYIVTQQSGVTLSARWILQDVNGLVTDIGLTGSGEDTYLTFNVPSETINQGNAILAVVDESNKQIVWSWHIWVTDEDLTQTKAASGSNQLAPVNIGWCDAKQEIYLARTCYVRATQDVTGTVVTGTVTQTPYEYNPGGDCPYYQWGRKDPLQASMDGSSNIDKQYYYQQSKYQPKHGQEGGVSLGTAIRNPHIHYNTGSGNGDWCSTTYYNLWSSTLYDSFSEGGARDRINSRAKTKTIYDPSPVGYRVPSLDAWSSFTLSNTQWVVINGNRGRTYGSGEDPLFLPCSGVRSHTTGELGNVGHIAYYWSTYPYNQNIGYSLEFAGGNMAILQDYNRTFGFPVRPIKE